MNKIYLGGLAFVTLAFVGAGCINQTTDTVTPENNASTSNTRYIIEDTTNGPYGIKEGHITLTQDSDFITTTTNTYFTDYGKVQVSDIVSTAESIGVTTNSRVITNLNERTFTSINLNEKSGFKTVYTKQLEKNLQSIGQAIKEQANFSVQGTEVVAGKECGVVNYLKNGGTVCLWEGIALKTTFGDNAGSAFSDIVATGLEVGDGVFDDSLLVIPEDIVLQEGSFDDVLRSKIEARPIY